MDNIDLRYVVTPIITAALADAFRDGFQFDQASTDCSVYANTAAPEWVDSIVNALAMKGHLAAYDVLFERARQQEQERFGASHDDAHTNKELAYAASAYLGPIWGIDTAKPDSAPDVPPVAWPWGAEWWKPGGNDLASYRRRLVKGAALAIAEIERVDRMIAGGAKADV